MKYIAQIVILLMSFDLYAKGSCTDEDIGLTPSAHLAERLFYTGTCHYRNGEYHKSVDLWGRLAKIENIDPRYNELQISAFNNLGYMLFFGNGVQENKAKAIEYWNKAISSGHTEAEYHLCHAYADVKVSTYNPVLARPHCEKARLIYQGIKQPDADEQVILKQIVGYLTQLGK